MILHIHPHAQERMRERGVSVDEVETAVESGELFVAKFGRTGFRRNFPFGGQWRGKQYNTKQVEVYAVREGMSGW